MKKIRVLQLGASDFSQSMQISDQAEWFYEPDLSQLTGKEFDVAILDREVSGDEFDFLIQSLRAYTLFATERVLLKEGGIARQLMAQKKGKQISAEELSVLLKEELPDYFSGSYGEKYLPQDLSVAEGFKGKIFWKGYEGVDLCGEFGDELTQIVFWRNNPPIAANQVLEYWLEYAKDTSVEIVLEVTIIRFRFGTFPESREALVFTERDLEDAIYIANKGESRGSLFVSLKARGTGNFKIIALHSRHSRRGKGNFIPGGKRSVTSDREEVFYYFDPGSLTPPLNVYFSGYKTKEGFEAYNIMERMGHPFLLITDTRLEGGAAYIGSEEYENAIEKIIRDHMAELGFQASDVILSGISMGSFGALYYGCRIQPYAIVVGKPLVSFGDIAENERINRPGGFPTSLDVLHKFCGNLSKDAVRRLNNKFWNVFDGTQWHNTQLALAYMIEDDYDQTAYEKLQSHLKGTGVKIYGKGLHGRHNDNSVGIVDWFLNQFHRIVQDDFENMRNETGGQRR